MEAFMVLEVKLGTAVNAIIDGHSSVNGATIPDSSSISMTSNDPTVALVTAPTLPPGGAQQLVASVTVLAVGSTDIHVTVTTPDGSVFEATATLIVDPAPEPGLALITLTLAVA